MTRGDVPLGWLLRWQCEVVEILIAIPAGDSFDFVTLGFTDTFEVRIPMVHATLS